MSAEYYRKMIDLRASLAQEREKKKADNAHYADLVKRASSPSSKATYQLMLPPDTTEQLKT